MVNGAHPWMLVGPWYRWPSPGAPASGRSSVPIIQKYDTSDLVNEFLKNPQHSLQFLEQEDRVFEVTPRVPPLPLLNGRRQSLSDNVLSNTGIRKLFLDTHKRFYLVVCELHCDMPGFPAVDRNEVCEAGFVIRRRAVQIPQAAEKSLRSALRNRATVAEIQTLAVRAGLVSELQGWIPSAFDRIGSWQKVTDEKPAVNITETIHPLYPLIPDPRLAKHAGKGRTIYFGSIPTAAADSDPLGNARFDDHNLYEIRSYVRRHKLPCPKLITRNDCHGPLTWSPPAESFQIASHFDLAGTSNRPVTIQLPDLPALQAQVAADPSIGRKGAVKMVAPKASNLEASGKIPDLSPAPGSPGASICFFCIPLITIVASFVLRLFLPMVVFVFQLSWMLALKLCIPPSFSLSAGVAAKLAANANADLDVGFAADVKADFAANLGTDAANSLDAQFSAGVQANLEVAAAVDLSADLPPDIQVDPSPAVPGYPSGSLPVLTANLIYVPEVPL
jgi:hypothetical protein